MNIAAGRFKAICLKLMDEVQATHERVVITKRGRPVAMLVSIDEAPADPLFGVLRDSVIKQGDLIGPIDESWDAER